MNIKVTDFELTENTSYNSIPCVIHFLPGCNDYEQSWRDLNPECMIISWDTISLQKVVNNSIASNINIDYSKDDFIVSSVLCYLYGGIVISKPEMCFVSLRNLLGHLPNTLLIVFELGESSLLDNSILISSAKISAFNSLMEYFFQAKKQHKSTAIVFRDFVKSSMEASNDGAIVCLHSNLKDKMTKAPKLVYHQDLVMIEKHISFVPKSFKIIRPSTFSSQVTPWLNKLGMTEINDSSAEKIGILVIDSETFNKEAPVPHAIAAVLSFQDCILYDDAIVIVAHSPPGGISLDMMLIPQLTTMNAKEIYRSDHVAWKLSKKL